MLSAVWHAIVDATIKVLNTLIAALGAVLSALFSALPDMPDLPDLPTPFVTAEAWVAWFIPVGTIADILVFTLAMWLLWQAVALALRWAKAIGD